MTGRCTTRILDNRPFFIERGSTVRVRQRASRKASKWPFLLPQRPKYTARALLNLSPRSVPNISAALQSWLEQRRLTTWSTSLIGSRFQRLLVVIALRRAEAAHHEHEFT